MQLFSTNTIGGLRLVAERDCYNGRQWWFLLNILLLAYIYYWEHPNELALKCLIWLTSQSQIPRLGRWCLLSRWIQSPWKIFLPTNNHDDVEKPDMTNLCIFCFLHHALCSGKPFKFSTHLRCQCTLFHWSVDEWLTNSIFFKTRVHFSKIQVCNCRVH